MKVTSEDLDPNAGVLVSTVSSHSDSKMRTKPVIFMTLLLVLLMPPLCLADGGDASGADGGSFYTFLLTK